MTALLSREETASVAGPVPRPRRLAGPVVGGVLLALAVVASGAALVREALVTGGVVSGASWWDDLAPRLAELRPDAVTDGVGAGVALLALALLWTALRPAPARGRRLGGGAAVVPDRDLARWVQARLDAVPGATRVRVRGGRRLVATITTLAPPAEHDDVEASVRADADDVLGAVESAPRLKVRLQHQDGVS
ncbi:hypothetical protein [Nocardioides sp.]|uniref:hypothetical protein n=1 Tax=Nocardioides sp. TaxID=35761 RepID=UPI0035188B71